MSEAKTFARNVIRLLDNLCDVCEYRDNDDPSYVKCSKSEFCNLKEMRELADQILNGRNEKGNEDDNETRREQADT